MPVELDILKIYFFGTAYPTNFYCLRGPCVQLLLESDIISNQPVKGLLQSCEYFSEPILKLIVDQASLDFQKHLFR